MFRGYGYSFALHILLLILVWKNWAHELFPEPEIRAIKVSLVTAKDVKKSERKPEEKAVKTQQSNAPKEAPQKKVKPKPKNEPKKNVPQVVQKSKSDKKVKQKAQEKQVEKEVEAPKKEVKEAPRPPKLDKTADKKTIMESEKGEMQETPADFLEALSFIDSLDSPSPDAKEAQAVGEDTDPTTVNMADQYDIAVIRKHIERNWYKTPGLAKGHTVHIMLKMNRDGTLRTMKVVQSSGNIAFDRSIERAVRKAVPLPLPAGKFDLFETIDLHFSDET